MTNPDQPARTRLGDAVRRRRQAFGLSAVRAAEEAGIARGTWTSLESGTRATHPHNYAAIERLLFWQPGSIEAILDGRKPTAVTGSVAHVPGASTFTTTYRLPDGEVVTVTEPIEDAPPGLFDVRPQPTEVFSAETEKRLRDIARNPQRSPGLRAMAQSLLTQLSALKEADAAEEEASREAG